MQMKCIGRGSKKKGMALFGQRQFFILWWSAHVARHTLEAPGEHGEALSFVQLQRGRRFDKNEPATEGEISAVRAVVGSRSWIARQCGPDEAGTASTLRRSDSRPLWKICQTQTDRSIESNRMKTSEFTFTSYRSTTFALLPSRAQHSALDRPDLTQGGLLMELTISESNTNGSSHLSRMTWSSHRVKRSVSACLHRRSLHAECKTRKRRVDPGSVGNWQSIEITAPSCTDGDVQFNFPPIVTVMKADSVVISTHPSCALLTPRMLLSI